MVIVVQHPKSEQIKQLLNIFPTSADPNFRGGYVHLIPRLNTTSPRLKVHLQTLGYVDTMATEDNQTRHDSIKIFESKIQRTTVRGKENI